MRTIDIKRDLVALGIDPEDYRVLKLLPLVYVAWADGKMESVERSRIVKLARERFPISARGAELLRDWLTTPPSREYIRHGLRDLLALALAESEFEIELDDLPVLLAHAEAIARSTAVALEAPSAVTPEEEAALSEIARMLSIDSGVSWAALLRELEGERESVILPVPGGPFPLVRRRAG
jgi:hypothetical protein